MPSAHVNAVRSRCAALTAAARAWHAPCIELGMPFKSQAQRRKFAQLLMEGKISNETFEEWNRSTGSAKLPERVRRTAKKTVKKSKTRQARKRKTKRRRA
jgi:hypothetical protein